MRLTRGRLLNLSTRCIPRTICGSRHVRMCISVSSFRLDRMARDLLATPRKVPVRDPLWISTHALAVAQNYLRILAWAAQDYLEQPTLNGRAAQDCE